MKNRVRVLNLLLSGMLLFTFSFVACGEESGEDRQGATDRKEGSEATSEKAESSGGTSSGEVYEQIAATVEGVQTKEDVEEADPRLEALYDDLYNALKNEMNNPGDAAQALENSRRMQAANERMEKHMQKLVRERPDAGMLLGAAVAKNGVKMAGLSNEAMKKVDPQDMQKMQQAMEEVKKQVREGK